jgi:hypothetical protein
VTLSVVKFWKCATPYRVFSATRQILKVRRGSNVNGWFGSSLRPAVWVGDGWWPAFFDADKDEASASAYATALVVLALHEYRLKSPARDGKESADIADAIEKAGGWLFSNHPPRGHLWADYPNAKGDVTPSRGVSALVTAVFLTACCLGTRGTQPRLSMVRLARSDCGPRVSVRRAIAPGYCQEGRTQRLSIGRNSRCVSLCSHRRRHRFCKRSELSAIAW